MTRVGCYLCVIVDFFSRYLGNEESLWTSYFVVQIHIENLLEIWPKMKQTPLGHSDFWATQDTTDMNELQKSCACNEEAIKSS